MKRLQLIITAIMMMFTSFTTYNHTGETYADNAQYGKIEQIDEIAKVKETSPVTVATSTVKTTDVTIPVTTEATTTTRKEQTITTITTVTTTTVTTTEIVTTAEVVEETTPVIIDKVIEEVETLEESTENVVYSTGERETPVEVVTNTWNRAEWDEASLPSFAITVTYDERDLQALYNVVQHEVGNCSQRSKYIVASAVINRVIDGWGSSIYNVVTAPGQFSGVWSYIGNTSYATQDTIDCVNYVLNSGIDFIDGGTSFYNPRYCGYMSWFENQELVGEFEGHRYFRQWN